MIAHDICERSDDHMNVIHWSLTKTESLWQSPSFHSYDKYKHASIGIK